MSFQLLGIALYSYTGERREVPLRPGVVNIITGGSKTGKSAIIDIVDYCLGRTEYVVAHGIIRDTVSWYAMRLQTEQGPALIARPAPPISQKQGTEAYFAVGGESPFPEFSQLSANANLSALKDFLSECAGIELNEHVPPKGQSRPPLRATIDHTKFYLFQQQSRLSDKSLLFYRQEEPWASNTIKDTLPFFLGAVGDDRFDRMQQLRRARRDLKLLERLLEDEESIKGRDSTRALSLYAEAQQVGLLPSVSPSDEFDELVNDLRRVPTWMPTADDNAGNDVLNELATRKESLQEQHRAVRQEIEAAQALGRDQQGFSDEVVEQKNRLQAISLFGNVQDHGPTCPLCSQELQTPVPTVTQMNESLVHLEKQINAVTRQRPRLEEYINTKEEQSTTLRRQIAETKAAIEAVLAQEEVIQLQRNQDVQRARIVGRVSLFLDSVTAGDGLSELRAKIDAMSKRVVELEAGISDEDVDERLEACLRIIDDQITKWARQLGLEHSENPLHFDLQRLTVMSFRDTGPIPLSEMGSGENWVGYHLSVLFALHKWFVEKKRPVPHLLMIDQPAQFFFPADVPKDADIATLKDEDREAVRRMFRFVFEVVESLKGKMQVIIIEHADLTEDWFKGAVIQRWRGGEKLIPEHWYRPNTTEPDSKGDAETRQPTTNGTSREVSEGNEDEKGFSQ